MGGASLVDQKDISKKIGENMKKFVEEKEVLAFYKSAGVVDQAGNHD